MQALSSYRSAQYSAVLHRSQRYVHGHVCCARQQCNSSRKRHVTTASMEEEAHRNTVKNLTRLFYGPSTATPQQPGSSQPRRPRVLKGSHIPNLPLWRVEWAVLPGMQEILHVLAPHYVHMFEVIFSRSRPWVFGHLYLPGGSKSLGQPTHALASGSKAPLVGVLMQVTRAVRLRDGKFLLLATALGRFKIVSCQRELPYSEADVELFEDCEHLDGLHTAATAAVLQAAPDDASVSGLMAASSAAAREAAAAAHWAWLRGYELKVAAGQDWPGPGPREGENDMETYHMVQELAAQGVADVLPLPDGVVIGRCNLQQVTQDVADAMQQAFEEAAAQLNSNSSSSSNSSLAGYEASSKAPGTESPVAAASGLGSAGSQQSEADSSSSSSGGDGSSESSQAGDGVAGIASLNTVAERGVALQGPEVGELTGSISCGSTEDVLMLEAAVWQQLDILAALSKRVKGRRHSLPFGLLQLRPPRPQLSVAAATMLANQAAAARTAAQGDAVADMQAASSRVLPSPATGPGVAQPAAAEVVSDTDDEDSSSGGTQHATTQQVVPSSSSSSSSNSAAKPTASDIGTGGDPSLSSRDAVAAADSSRQLSFVSQYAFAASEGMDVHADPLWPPLRRAARLSWAAALVTGEFDLDKGPQTSDLRQALLETPSIAARLRYVLAVLQKHAKVLAALAAVKDVHE